MRRREKGNEVDNLEDRRQREGGLRVMATIVGLSVLQGQWLGMMLECYVRTSLCYAATSDCLISFFPTPPIEAHVRYDLMLLSCTI